MTKRSKIVPNEQRRRTVAKYAARRAQLTAINSSPNGTPAADGFAVVFATEPARSGAFFRELRDVVRNSRGAVLISLRRPSRWPGGPVVGVHLRHDRGPDQRLSEGVWLGPLREEADRDALCAWLRRGGPQAGPPPRRLLARKLPGPMLPLMAAQTHN